MERRHGIFNDNFSLIQMSAMSLTQRFSKEALPDTLKIAAKTVIN